MSLINKYTAIRRSFITKGRCWSRWSHCIATGNILWPVSYMVLFPISTVSITDWAMLLPVAITD